MLRYLLWLCIVNDQLLAMFECMGVFLSDFAENSDDASLEVAKIALPSIGIGSLSQQNS